MTQSSSGRPDPAQIDPAQTDPAETAPVQAQPAAPASEPRSAEGGTAPAGQPSGPGRASRFRRVVDRVPRRGWLSAAAAAALVVAGLVGFGIGNATAGGDADRPDRGDVGDRGDHGRPFDGDGSRPGSGDRRS